MMPGMRMLAVFFAISALVGCKTMSEWSEWQDITAEQSVVKLVWPADAKRPARVTHHANAFEAAW